MQYEIRPAKRLRFGHGEMWEYREFIYYFTWCDIKVCYKRIFLGAAWAILQPLHFSSSINMSA
ncbi:MAG: Teichoic acid translocation permease protein TagG [Bacteroidota bacterium]